MAERMTEQELQAIKERAEAATPGPWEVVKSKEAGVQIGTAWKHGQLKAGVPVVTTAHGVNSVTIYINDGNAEFIAAAREDVSVLLDEVERLTQIIRELHAEKVTLIMTAEMNEATLLAEIERLEGGI